jgi:hypothetical protein
VEVGFFMQLNVDAIPQADFVEAGRLLGDESISRVVLRA